MGAKQLDVSEQPDVLNESSKEDDLNKRYDKSKLKKQESLKNVAKPRYVKSYDEDEK